MGRIQTMRLSRGFPHWGQWEGFLKPMYIAEGYGPIQNGGSVTLGRALWF